MPMNEIIREKRKSLGLTQEQVAERLGVSAPAVNKWEKGATYPDVTLLPALARLLGTDLNTLLCFQDGLSQQEIGQILQDAALVIKKEGIQRGFDTVLQKVREYPACIALVHQAAMLLQGALIMAPLDAAEKGPLEAQVTALYVRVVASGEEPFAGRAAFLLVSQYLTRDEFTKAQELLDTLPERSAMEKRTLQSALFLKQKQPERAAPILEQLLRTNASLELQGILHQLAEVALQEGRAEDAEEIARRAGQVAQLLELGDYYAAMPLFDVAVARQDVPGALSALKTMLAAITTSLGLSCGLFYRHIAAQSPAEAVNRAAVQLFPPLLKELEENETYEFLRPEPEFQQLLRQYRAQYPAEAGRAGG